MATPMTTTKLLAQLKKWGVPFKEYKSWRTHNRNHKGAWGPVHGFMVHHTGSDNADQRAMLYNGLANLPGPLCHFGLAQDGTVHLIGWGRANHAGSGDPDVLSAVIAESYGKTPPADRRATVDGNSRFYGVEIWYSGSHKMTDAQYATLRKLSAAICDAHGWSAKSVIGHGEWQPGKWDPGHKPGQMMDMAAVRADIASTLSGKAATPPATPKPPAKPDPATVTPKSREPLSVLTAQVSAAMTAWPFIRDIELAAGLPKGLLFAVGSRETNLKNLVGDGGHAYGVWQRDDRWWPVDSAYLSDVRVQAEDAAALLKTHLTATDDLASAVAAYNAGLSAVTAAVKAGQSPDSVTTGRDYAADVLGRMAMMSGQVPDRVVKWLPVSGHMPELRHGDRGWHVGWLQRNLRRFGHGLKVTEVYDDATAKAVHAFYAAELDYETTTAGKVFGADGWRRVLSISKEAR
ncbi:N-acetylmuramoyl-L-alanine amidase [Streptomyces albidoflavus]